MDLKKIKKIKPLYLLLLLVIGILLLVFSNPGTESCEEKPQLLKETTYNSPEELEKRLADIIKKIDGVGNCSVFVTLENNGVKKHATNVTDDKTNTKDSVSTKKDVSAVMEKKTGIETPYIYEETMPQIRGVLIVASGVENKNVTENITTAVSAVLGVSLHKVKVLPAKN